MDLNTYLTTGGGDKTIRIYDLVAIVQELLQLQNNTEAVVAMLPRVVVRVVSVVVVIVIQWW